METVEDKEYYHIKKPNTGEWNKGDKYFFGSDKIFFICSFDNSSLTWQIDDKNFFLKTIFKNLNDYCKSKKDLNEQFEILLKKTDQIIELAYISISSYTLFIREHIFEEVHQQFFPQNPSRQRGIWLIPIESDNKSLNYWKKIISGTIFKLKVTGKIHIGSEKYLSNDTFSFNEYRQNAFKYWSSASINTECDEIIFEGLIEIIDILNP